MSGDPELSSGAAPLLRFDALSLTRGDGSTLVDALSLDVERGRILALVGESGSGKTLAARAVLGLLPVGVTHAGGRVLFGGADLTAMTQDQLRAVRGRRIGLVLQEPLTALNPALRIGEQLIEGLLLDGAVKPAEARDRAVAMLERVRIEGAGKLLNRHPHEFSGGMRQRIMLASVMLTRPDLIIADEPTTALDTLAQREVLDLMVELGTQMGVAVLLITHNLALAGRYAQNVAVMQSGRLVEAGAAAQVLSSPRHDYTRALLAAAPQPHVRTAPAPARPADARPLLSVRDLSVVYPGRGVFKRGAPTRALDQVGFSVGAGEIVAVVGGSGSGKTTLGRAVMGLLRPSSGQVVFAGEAAAYPRQPAFRDRTQMIFQDPFSSLDPRRRVIDIVADPLRRDPGLTPDQRRGRAQEQLDQVGLGELGERFPHQLSGGQRQRAAIARALVRRPDFVVADEPTSALDVTVQAQVLRMLQALQRARGFACLFISHDLGVVAQIADRVLVMEAGRIVEEGDCARLLNAPTHPYTAALIEATPRLEAIS